METTSPSQTCLGRYTLMKKLLIVALLLCVLSMLCGACAMASQFDGLKPGDTVIFGQYEQDCSTVTGV